MYKIYFRSGDEELELNVYEGCYNSAILQNLKDLYYIVPKENQLLYFEHPRTGFEKVDVNQRLSELLKGLKENRFVFRFENNDETNSEPSLQSKQSQSSKTQLQNDKEIRKTIAMYNNQFLINSVQYSPFNIKMKEFLENYCDTQVAILLDSTHSMKVHLDFSLNLIKSLFENNQIIQCQKSKYAAVCYQDKLEDWIIKNSYPFLQFSKEKNNIFEFLSKVNFCGGGDEAEDVKGGIEDLCNNLEWNSELKIAVLICDSPSHGKLWAGNVLDFHQYIDLKPALQLLIDKNIILVGIQFNDKTKQMYQQMKIFYENQGKQDYLLIIESKQQNQINMYINDHLQNFLTKQQNQIRQQSVINNIDQQILNTFIENNKNQQLSQSLTIEEISIIGDSFISLYQNQTIQQNDFSKKQSSESFIIDSNYCQFQNQIVYLAQSMNNKNSNMNRLFTLNSIPYQTFDEVIKTQQIYFITKNLFDSFKETLLKKIQKNDQLTQIELQEKYLYKQSESQIYQLDQFFNNDQYKLYNNNQGFLLDEKSQINYILQSFSLYTLYKSQWRFIILNIKTVGNYICTPTLNTFDQLQSLENGGQQAIYQFINKIMKIKIQCNEYLKYFGIELELEF